MKKSLFLLSLIILFKPVLPVFEYLINYEYISKELCVNKENIIKGCDGKCYLLNQLVKSTESEKPKSDKFFYNKQIELLFFIEITQVSFLKKSILQKPFLNFHYSNLYYYLNSNSTFHPPSYIS